MAKYANNDNIFRKGFNWSKEKFADYVEKVTWDAVIKYGLELDENGNAIDCQADAFRHAYMQCWLTYFCGESVAKKLGDMIEKDKNPKIDKSTNMDLWNNQIGREIAKDMINENKEELQSADFENLQYIITEKVIEKMEKDELITNPKIDKRKYENMEKERLKDSDRVFYEGEYWDDMDEDERRRFSEHYANYKNRNQKGFPSKAELDKRADIGELIYVDNYVRVDGTKVRGYYRRRVKY